MKPHSHFRSLMISLTALFIVLALLPVVDSIGKGHLGLKDYPGPNEDFPIVLTWDYNIYVMGPSEIKDFVRLAKEKNIDQINLRINNKGVINARIDHGTVYRERLDAFGPDFDPLRVLVEEGHRIGIKVGVHSIYLKPAMINF